MKGLSLLLFTLLYLLITSAQAAIPVARERAGSVPVQETSQSEVSTEEARQAEIDELVRKLAAMSIDLKRPADKEPPSPSDAQRDIPLYTKKSVRTMSLGDLLDYQDQLRAHLAELENKERKAKEEDRLRAEKAEKNQADKNIAIRQLREVDAELGDVLIRRAMKGVGKMVPVPKYTDYEKEQAGQSSGRTGSGSSNKGSDNESDDGLEKQYPDHEYIDYEIDAPVVITGKPAKKVRIKARKGVMELHQQIQDLNQVLIDSAKRMVGKPF